LSMLPKRMGLLQRAKALVLLKKGHSPDETARILRQRYHPTDPVDDVKRKYFPAKGAFAIGRLEGATREEIAANLGKMKSYQTRGREFHAKRLNTPANLAASRNRMISQQKDPSFRKKNIEATKRYRQDPQVKRRYERIGRRSLSRLRQDPAFVEAERRRRSELMVHLNKDPNFVNARNERSRVLMTRLNRDPDFVAARNEAMRKLGENPKFAEARRNRAKKIMAELRKDPGFVKATNARLRKYARDPELNAQRRERMKKKHQDPNFARIVKETASKTMQKLHQDPAFNDANKERSKKVMAQLRRNPQFLAALKAGASTSLSNLHKRPDFAAGNRARAKVKMTSLNQDPVFKKARLEGIAQHWNTYRLRIADYAQRLEVGGAGLYPRARSTKKIDIHQTYTTRTPATILQKRERKRVIRTALSALPELERETVLTMFNLEKGSIEMQIGQAAAILGKTRQEIQATYENALAKLAQNTKIRELR